jgi:uncharacterized repeat protein (TIGR03803 family)
MAALLAAASAATAQTVEKVYDLTATQDEDTGAYLTGWGPVANFVQAGTNLWFTTPLGGTNSQGTVSRFDLVTRQVVTVASLSTNNTDGSWGGTGGAPQSPLLVDGDQAYFTTTSGGTGAKGTIAKLDLSTGLITPLYSFPSSGAYGALHSGNLTKIQDSLYLAATAGGTYNQGAVIRYDLTSATATALTNFFFQNKTGIQPFGGMVQAGSSYYFTTLQGGATAGTTIYPVITNSDGTTKTLTVSLALGAGTLSRLSFDNNGNPVIAPVVSLRGGWEQSPSSAPVVVNDSLYFLAAGYLSFGGLPMPGAILRYDVNTGFCTNLCQFSTNLVPSSAYGLQPGFSSPTEWQGDLYFINHHGGTNATLPTLYGGTLIKYNISSGTLTKLADFTNNPTSTGLTGTLGAPNTANGAFASGTIVEETNRFFLYYPLPSGGDNGRGTLIRVSLPPQPIYSQVALNGSASLNLSWTGGYPPFDVLTNGNLSNPAGWAPIQTGISADTNTTNWAVSLPVPTENLFYRVRGQNL